jgi:hypothetical protein
MDDNSKGSIVGNINPFSQIFGSSAGQRPEVRIEQSGKANDFYEYVIIYNEK